MMTAPRVAAVVVTYNSAEVLGGCLQSLPAGAEGVRLVDVVVADNASRDESLRIAKETTHLPVRTVQLGRNAGYAAAVNVGVEALTGIDIDAVIVLNPDCRLHPGALAHLAEALRRPGYGISVPRLVNPNGTLQPSLRRMPTVRRAFAEAVIGGNLAGRIGTLGELITDPRVYEHAGEATWATGAAMLISSDVLREIGPWQETFLLYSEETEFTLRAADNGWKLWYEPAAVVEHIGGESSTSPMLAALLTVNKVRLFRQRHSRVAALAYYLAMLLGVTARAIAGRPTARASLIALTRPSRRMTVLPG
jgi:GT2 family glycosyltransferase